MEMGLPASQIFDREEYLRIQAELKKPFPVEWIEFRNQGKSGLALTYVEVWRYLDILDAVAPGKYHFSEPVVVQSLTDQLAFRVSLTICGVVHTDISNLDSTTNAYAQVVKRVCARHGLGRFLYYTPTLLFMYGEEKYPKLKYSTESVAAFVYDSLLFEVPTDFRRKADSLPNKYVPGRSSYSAPAPAPTPPQERSNVSNFSPNTQPRQSQQPPAQAKLRVDADGKPYVGGFSPKQAYRIRKETGLTDEQIATIAQDSDTRSAVMAIAMGSSSEPIANYLPAGAGSGEADPW